MTTNLIEQAKAMAERLERIDGFGMKDEPWIVEAAALIRQLIARIEGGK